MPKYLVEASYTVDGVQGLLKEGGSTRYFGMAVSLRLPLQPRV